MERPRSAKEMATPMEALEIIRRIAVRYGDDQIASVLNRRGYSTGKGKRWNQTRRQPGGGFKYSGVGREYGRYGIEAFLEPRAILGDA
jgi:hypothetical protein